MWDSGCYNKLTFELRKALDRTRKQYTTFQQLDEAARVTQNAFNATDRVQNRPRGSSSNNNTTLKNQASISAPGSLPASTTSRGLTRLIDEERDRLRAENRCFRCREVGHASRDCPRTRKATRHP
jgi:hypothetical protein